MKHTEIEIWSRNRNTEWAVTIYISFVKHCINNTDLTAVYNLMVVRRNIQYPYTVRIWWNFLEIRSCCKDVKEVTCRIPKKTQLICLHLLDHIFDIPRLHRKVFHKSRIYCWQWKCCKILNMLLQKVFAKLFCHFKNNG